MSRKRRLDLLRWLRCTYDWVYKIGMGTLWVIGLIICIISVASILYVLLIEVGMVVVD